MWIKPMTESLYRKNLLVIDHLFLELFRMATSAAAPAAS